MKCDVCGARLLSRRATAKDPYQYALSGLPNVYLVGVELRRCPAGHGEVPVIVRMSDLHRSIARALIEKPVSLTGDEVRYLRKFAGMAATDFAAQLRVAKHTLSRIENGTQKMGATADKLTRAIAAAARDMKETRAVLLAGAEQSRRAWQRVVLKPTARGWSEAA